MTAECSNSSEHRVYAPQRNIIPERRVEPDWYWSVSGGLDSVAAYLVTREALHENYQKRPLMVYLDTRIGIPLNRIYVEHLADHYDEQLWSGRTEWKFEDYLEREDAPGPGAHEDVRKGLKGRQSSTLITRSDFPIVVQGISADESDHRASLPKMNEKRRHWEAYPVHRLTLRERAAVVIEADAPINPLWCFPEIFTDCGCGANGDPSEFDRVQELFPVFAQRLREYEESIDADGVRDTLGWGGLTASEQRARADGYEQATLTTCGVGCQRARDPVVVQAFKARLRGATKGESIAILQSGANDE